MKKKNIFILSTCLNWVLINPISYGQNVEDSICKKALLSSVKIMLDDSILVSPDIERNDILKYLDFYVYPSQKKIENHRLLLFEDRRTKFQDHGGFRGKAFIDDECEMIVPRRIQHINSLVNKEQGWSNLDIAFLYMYFNLNIEGRITFWTTGQYKHCLRKSGLFTLFYGNQGYFFVKAKKLKKECKQLFIDNDSLVQFVVIPTYDEFLESGNDTIRKNIAKIYKLVTISFSKNRHVISVKKYYFIPGMKSEPKGKQMVFYSDLIRLMRSEKLQLPIDPRR